MSPEMVIRQYDGLKYIDGILHIINYSSFLKPDQHIQRDLDKQLRICTEIYLSKI